MIRSICTTVCFLALFGFVSAFTGQSYKMKVTYYDFHEDKSNPDFNSDTAVGVTLTNLGLVRSTLDADSKPVASPNAHQKYYVANVEKWFRPWQTGQTYKVFRATDTTLVPIDSTCTYYPDLEMTLCDYTRYDTLVRPDSTYYIPCDTCFKSVVVNDSLPFTQKAETFNGSSRNFYMLNDNTTDKRDFFPLDGKGFEAIGYPRFYGASSGSNSHNFSFSMEMHYTFSYHGGEVLYIAGDDDIWVFINNQLAIDMGGLHAFLEDTVSLNSLGLTAGQTYNFDMFYCERHIWGSNLIFKTDIDFVAPRTLGALPGPINPTSRSGKEISFGKIATLHVPVTAWKLAYSIVDANGRQVLSQEALVSDISTTSAQQVSALPAGIYFVKAECRDRNNNYVSTVMLPVVKVK